MSETKVCHFTICGEGLTDIVRQMYCYEDKQLQALEILESLDGITITQARRVCEGKARLEDKPDDPLLYYINAPDEKFIKNYEEHLIWKEKHLKEEAEELSLIMKGIERNPEKARNVAYNPDIMRSLTSKIAKSKRDNLYAVYDAPMPLPFDIETDIAAFITDLEVPEPSEETIRVAKWNVPKNLLDRYATHVVKRIRATLRCGAIRMVSPGELYSLEIERQTLHDAICKAVGFDHQSDEPSKEQREFDFAIGDYLDKHAGSLLNGDE